MEAKLCQSCGMPLTSEFTAEFNKDAGTNFTKEEAIAGMKEFFPTLKRWQV